MDYRKKDGTLVTEEWMDSIAEAAEADELSDPIVAMQKHDGYVEDYATVPVQLSRSCLNAVEKAAERIGESSSDFIRHAVDKALFTA